MTPYQIQARKDWREAKRDLTRAAPGEVRKKRKLFEKAALRVLISDTYANKETKQPQLI